MKTYLPLLALGVFGLVLAGCESSGRTDNEQAQPAAAQQYPQQDQWQESPPTDQPYPTENQLRKDVY